MDVNFRLPSADMAYSSEIQRTATNAAMTRKTQINYKKDCRESGESGSDSQVRAAFLGPHCGVTLVTEKP
jgi:hypothetical protein